MLRLCFISLLLACLLLSGCGQVFISAFSAPGGPSVVTGVVSIVHITIINGNVFVTVVTLINAGIANDLTFCGDQRNLFPMDTSVTTTFTQGAPCATILQVTPN